MTSHSRLRRRVAGSVVGTGLAVSLSLGFGAASANADVLDALSEEFSRGSGAGQVANLVNESITLRAQGYPPTQSDLAAVEASLAKRPNQGPMISALSATVAHQRKRQGMMSGPPAAPQLGFGINTEPWNPGNPMIQDDPIFPMPGRS